jgi:photosystem II stability/assembly factor-like uncharacterized protein
MKRSRPFLLAAFLLQDAIAVALQAGDRSSPALTPEVLKGSCEKCGGAFELDEIQFASRDSGWAKVFVPNRGEGNSITSLARTTDGGRTWRRVSFVEQRGSDPVASVDGAAAALIAWMNRETGSWQLGRTTDGGRTWRNRPTDRVVALASVGRNSALALLGEKPPEFASTSDGGGTWKKRKLPLKFGELMSFNGRRIGVIVGLVSPDPDSGDPETLGVSVLHTVNGGETWAVSQLPNIGAARTHSLTWSDSERGWLVVWSRSGSTILRSRDGGATWQKVVSSNIDGSRRFIRALIVSAGGRGFIATEGLDRDDTQIGWTTDGGDTWTPPISLPRKVSSCQGIDDEIWCASGMDLLKFGRK